MVVFIQRLCRSVIALVLVAFIGSQPLAAQPSSAIRVLDRRLAEALRDGVERSPTLQVLVDELEHSDVIVHVIATPVSVRHPHTGRLAFVSAAGVRRYLRITIDAHLGHAARASLLGHELYHAVEVAREPTVVDQETFASLYRRLGQSSDHWSQCFDTVGAQHAGQQVLTEMSAARTARPASALMWTGR